MNEKNKVGRPPSKISTRAYINDTLIKLYDEYATFSFEQEAANFFRDIVKDADFFKSWSSSLSPLDKGDISSFFEDEMEQFNSTGAKGQASLSAYWFYLAGIMYGSRILAEDNVLDIVLNHEIYDYTNATALLKETIDNPRFIRPSDLVRKVRKPIYERCAIIQLRIRIKELGQNATLNKLSEEFEQAQEVIESMVSEANRQKLCIETGTNNQGDTFFMVK